ncbi:hypothetical protein QZH41_015947 [Actinostola sp. cb2023]|nr:hypothetical protein QZH41_015947 [Actinostola sp. cb2023]
MDKYLKAVEPLVDKEDFTNTKQIVEEFRKPGGLGEILQDKLLEHARQKDNWSDFVSPSSILRQLLKKKKNKTVSNLRLLPRPSAWAQLIDWWNNIGYLEQRVPLPINFSPGTTFPKEVFKDSLGYLKYSSRMISNVLKFKDQIDNETLTVDMMGKDPLNMAQYKVLFGGVRVPLINRDQFVLASKDKSKHILVAYRNQFFVFDVYHSDGKPLSESALMYQLLKVVENDEALEQPIGILTTTDRTSWAKQRKQLSKDKRNKLNLELIGSALFVVCLDKPPVPSTQAPSMMEDATNSVTARQNLHGDGLDSNSMNRWFDKTLNLVYTGHFEMVDPEFCISEDGHCGAVYEHTPAEAPPVARLWDFTVENREGYESISPCSNGLPNPVKLKWDLHNSTVEAITIAKYQMESTVTARHVHRTAWSPHGTFTARHGHRTARSPHGMVTAQQAWSPHGTFTARHGHRTARSPHGMVTAQHVHRTARSPHGMVTARHGHRTARSPHGMVTAQHSTFTARHGHRTARSPHGMVTARHGHGHRTTQSPHGTITVTARHGHGTTQSPHGTVTARHGHRTAWSPHGTARSPHAARTVP